MSFRFEREGNDGVITLTGSLTVGRACELKSILLGSLEKADRFTVKLVDVEEVDITGVQILYSAHRLFAAEKKELAFLPDSFETAMNFLKRLGIKRPNGCKMDLNSDCLWEKVAADE